MIEMDPHPTLGGTLNLNGHYVYGGDIQTSVFGINVPVINGLLELILQSNQLTVDMGTILTPAGMTSSNSRGTNLDLGYIVDPVYSHNNLDFGNIVN